MVSIAGSVSKASRTVTSQAPQVMPATIMSASWNATFSKTAACGAWPGLVPAELSQPIVPAAVSSNVKDGRGVSHGDSL